MSDKLHIAIKEEAINLQIGGGGAGVGGGGVAIQGSGTYIRDVGTVQFSNSNSMTFGLNTNGIMTASFSQSTHPHDYVATSVSSLLQHTTATSLITSNAVNTNQLSNLQYTSGTSVITSAAFPSANTTKFAGTGTSGTNVTMTLNSNGLALSVDPPGVGGSVNWSTSTQTGSKIDISTATDVNTLYYGNFLTVAAGAGAALKGSGTYTQNSGTIEFANSNGLTFGLTDNQMTASYSQSTHAHDYVATSASSLLQHTSATSAITSNAVNTSITSQWLTTAMASENTSVFAYTSNSSLLQHTSATSAITSNAINTSVSGSFQLTSDNSLSLGTGYTTHTHEYQSTGNYLTTQTADTQFVGLLTTGVTGFNATINSSQLLMSVVDGSIYFNDSNGVTFGISTDGSSSTVTASVYTDYQSTGAYLTTAAASDHTHSQYLNTSLSSQFTSQSYQPVAFSGSNTSTTASTISFGNSNGLSFYLTNGSLVGSYSVPAGVSGSWELEGANTAGTTGSEYQTLYLSGGQNVTLEGSSNTIIFNVNATGAQDGGNVLAVSGSTASSTGTVAFWNANDFTFGFSESTRITASFSQSTHAHDYLLTANSSLLQHTSATSAITSNAFPTANSTQLAVSSVASRVIQINGSSGSISFNTGSSLSSSANASGITLGLASNISTAWSGQTTANQSRVVQINGSSNSISFNVGSSLSSSANASAITFGLASNITSALQSAGAYLTTAAQSNQVVNSFNGTTGPVTVNAGSYMSLSNNGSAFTFNVTGLQATSATSAITSNAVNTSQSSLFQHTSATSAITANAMNTSERGNYFYTSNNTFANSTHAHGGLTINATNISTSITSASNGLTINLSAADPGAAEEYNYISLYGNTSNASTVSGSSILLYGGDNITLAVTNGSVKIEGGAGGGGVAIADTASTVTNNTVVFSNSNGVSFGLNGSTMTASYTVPASGTLSYINTNGVSFISSSDGSTTSISASVETAYIPLANSTNFNQIWQISSNTSGTSSSSFGSILRLIGSDNITLSGGSNGISILGGGGGAGTSIVAGDYLSSSLVGSTLSLSVTGLMATGERANYFYTSNNTFANSTHSHGDISIAGTNISATTASASSGMTLSLSVADPGAAEEYNYITLYGNTSNASTASGSSILLSAGNNITLAASGGSIKIEGGAGGGGVAVQGSGTYIHTSGTAIFQTGNGITFGLSDNGVMTASYTVPPSGTLSYINTNGVSFISASDGSTTSISASVETAYIALANSTNFVQQVYLSGNTGGTSSSSVGSILKLAGGANITLSMSTNGYVSIIGGAGGGGVALEDGAATITNGTAYLSDANGISFGINGSTITGSHNAYSATSMISSAFDALANTTNYAGVGETTAGAISLTVNTAGVNASVPAVGYLSLVNSAGYTWSTSVNGVSTAIWLVLA